ncbi:MAG: HutP family protein [Clostridia bacterium]|nr:HutP family protein [Clostridia bacterium]
MDNSKIGSREVCEAAIRLAITENREDEQAEKQKLREERNILTAASDFGGEFLNGVSKIIERALVAARREGLIDDSHAEEGAVAGAAMSAVNQIVQKAMGLNVGGKIAVARSGDHVCVCIFLGIGVLSLNEMSIAIGHRAI